MAKKYLDAAGLSYFLGKLKSIFIGKKSGTLADGKILEFSGEGYGILTLYSPMDNTRCALLVSLFWEYSEFSVLCMHGTPPTCLRAIIDEDTLSNYMWNNGEPEGFTYTFVPLDGSLSATVKTVPSSAEMYTPVEIQKVATTADIGNISNQLSNI